MAIDRKKRANSLQMLAKEPHGPYGGGVSTFGPTESAASLNVVSNRSPDTR